MKRGVKLVVLLVSIQYFGYREIFSIEIFFFPSVVKSWFWKLGIVNITRKISLFVLIIVILSISILIMTSFWRLMPGSSSGRGLPSSIMRNRIFLFVIFVTEIKHYT